jgi:hypothetical protein
MRRGFQSVIEAVPGLSRLSLVGLMRQLRAPHIFPVLAQLASNDELALRIVEEAIAIAVSTAGMF